MLLVLKSFYEKVAHKIFASIWEATSIVSGGYRKNLKTRENINEAKQYYSLVNGMADM